MKRTAIVKNPKKGPGSPRETSPDSDQGGLSQGPFGKKPSQAVSHQPNHARENYVNQEDAVSNGIMSTQNQVVVGDHSSIYLNTEEAATRLAEDGINHNIEEAVS